MPALDSTRRVFNPVSNAFLDIPDNVQFIAAVNRGSEFSGTFGIDAAQLDRFAGAGKKQAGVPSRWTASYLPLVIVSAHRLRSRRIPPSSGSREGQM